MEMAPVRIAQIVGMVQMSGVDAVVMNYYRHIDKSKFQFDYFMDGLEKTPIDDEILTMGGRIYKLPPYQKDMKKNLAVFRSIINENDYKIIHSHMNTLSVFWLREAKKAGVPVRIAHSHSTAGKGEGMRNIMKYMLRPLSKIYANNYCACSNYAGRWLFGKNVNIIRNAIKADDFIYNEILRKEVKDEFGLTDEIVIGHVGRFMYQKNHDFLVNIFCEIEKLNKNVKLFLVGEGPLRSKIEEQIKEKKLENKVIFTGTRTDVTRLLQGMDCFVLPSHYEGLGLSAVEAQAAGLPCFISDKVPDEAMLNEQCWKYDLKLPSKVWAKEILEKTGLHQRKSNIEEIVKKGYDIKVEAGKLERYYEEL